MPPSFLLIIAVVMLACILLNIVSSKIGVPTLLAFMLLGILFANNGIWAVRFDDYEIAKETCTVALIFIMFYGGFGTRWEGVKSVALESALLASVGVVATAGLVGVFCHFALGWKWLESLLFGSVMASTDAASVFSILRGKRLGLKNNTAGVLEIESGSNDPAAYMLTAIILSIMNGSANGGMIAWTVFAQLAFGAGCGLLIAKLASLFFQRMDFSTDGFDSIFIFAIAIVAYAIPTMIGGNGYLSAYLVGIILGNEELKDKKALVSFFDGVTGLMQMVIFFLLGLLARPAMLHKAILPAIAIFAFMFLVARPLSIFGVLTPFRKYGMKQQALISFAGLRGAASIVFAIMAMVDPAFLQNDIFNIVFVVVLLSISLQGSLIPWAAKKLDMIDPGTNVMKTFNDYSEGSDMNFGKISIAPESSWAGKDIRDLNLPGDVRIALILRGKERIQPRGHTCILPGDEVITLTKGFDDNMASLYEKTIKKGSRRVGQPISEYPGKGLILMVRRGDENIVASGHTILHEGDRIVILNMNDEQ